MGFRCEVIADSISPIGKRLTTLEVTYPRFIHSEILTHRDRARNSGSSRAIPWPTMCERIENDPVIPIKFGMEQSGMVTGDALSGPQLTEAIAIWLQARDSAISYAKRLHTLGVHKSLCNRITEPWMWITVVMTATEWKNLFRQRVHPDAEIHFQEIATMMQKAINNHKPIMLNWGEWHLPYITDECWVEAREFVKTSRPDFKGDVHAETLGILQKVSVARCARVSYVQHGEKARSIDKDVGLWQRLREGSSFGHWSPFEHAAMPINDENYQSGPFRGWKQYRKFFQEENVPG